MFIIVEEPHVVSVLMKKLVKMKELQPTERWFFRKKSHANDFPAKESERKIEKERERER